MRAEKRLSARAVATLGAGYHADGGGLYLQVTPTGARSWIFRFTLKGRRREMGLGPVAVIGLAAARERALEARRLLLDGTDPIEHRKRVHVARGATWGDCVDAVIRAQSAGWRNEAQADQWTQSLRDYGPDRGMPLERITTAVAVERLERIWTAKTETATRLRGRCERVWDYAKVHGMVSGDNPFRWRGHLDKLLPPPRKVTRPGHFAAMPYADLPAFMARLRDRDGLARRALEFTILTACRTGEVIGATRDEFRGDLWTIPGHRMKSGKPHVVPLVPRAVELLGSGRKPFPLSENGMLALLQRQPPKGFGLPYTVHGFRSSFRDWGAEQTAFPRELLEKALAHTIRDKAEAAYQRGDLLDKRREMMEAWAEYMDGH
jgi:integrase